MKVRKRNAVPFALLKSALRSCFFRPGASRPGTTTTSGFLLLFAVSWSAFAQPVGSVFYTLEAVSADAELVVRGAIVAVENPDKPPSYNRWDAVTFSVEESLKGAAPKILQFVIPPVGYPDSVLTNWIASKTPLLIFLSESSRLRSRQVSRFRYTPLTRAAVVDLSSNAPPQYLTLDYQAVRGAAAILAQAKTAIVAMKSGAHDVISTNVQIDRLPKGYFGSSVTLLVPKRREPDIVLRPDLSPRFTPKAQYDGNRILAARDKDAYLWDAATGKLIRKFTGSAEDVQAVTFCPVGHFSTAKDEILTGSGKLGGISKDNGIRRWNVEDGTVKALFGPLMGPVRNLQWAPDGRRFLSFSLESSAVDSRRHRLWEDFGETELFVFPGDDPFFSTDSAMVVTRSRERGDEPGFVGVWDARTYLQLCTLPGEKKTYFSARFSPYGNRVVTTARVYTNREYLPVVEIWDAETGRHLLDLNGAPRAFDAAYTRDGASIVTANHGTSVGVWNAESGELVRTLECPRKVHAILLSPDGRRCLATWGPGLDFGKTEGASLWDIHNGNELLQLKHVRDGVVGFSADGATIFAFDNAERTIGIVWSAETGEVLRTIRLRLE